MDICKIAGCLLFIAASFQPVDGQQKLIEEAKLFAFGAVAGCTICRRGIRRQATLPRVVKEVGEVPVDF